MRYQGGKSRIAKPIAAIISQYGDGMTFVSLFCGACSVESRVTGFNKIICNDKHEYLVAMLKAIQDGWEPPGVVTEEEFHYIRKHKDENKALAGFVGFGCTFGGAWDGGYARSKDGTNYASISKKSIMQIVTSLKNAEFLCMDYRSVEIPDECIVYADPPYANSRRYSGLEAFDSDSFWSYMRTISTNHLVFISEQSAPDDFISIWEKQVTRTIYADKDNYCKVNEKLFIHKNWQDRVVC